MNVVSAPPRFARPIETALAGGACTIENVAQALDLIDRLLRGPAPPPPLVRACLDRARTLLLDARRTQEPDAIAAARAALAEVLEAGANARRP